MRRLLTLMTVLILGAMAVRTQDDKPNPYKTAGMLNGVAWRSDPYEQKVAWVAGAMEAFAEGALYMQVGGGCVRNTPTWFNNKSTPISVTKEMDSFYQEGVTVFLPMIDAYEYSEMKIGGATKQELDNYKTAALKAYIDPRFRK